MEFLGTPRPDFAVDVDEVARAVERGDGRLLDARAPERFDGVVEPIDRVAGHIPGARNYFFMRSVDDRGRFLPAAALRAQITSALDGVDPDKTIVYCGSGVTAAHNLLAMEHAGLAGAKLYAGSWSEWSSDRGARDCKARRVKRRRLQWTRREVGAATRSSRAHRQSSDTMA